MGAPDPISSPSSHDSFSLDGQSIGLIAKITSGGNAKVDIQDMGSPLTKGEVTVIRQQKNVVVTYEVRLWEPAHFQTWDALEAMLRAGKNALPPKSYVLTDLRLPWLTKVVCEDIGPEMVVARGGPWAHSLTFHQRSTPKPFGGAAKDPTNPTQQAIKDTSAENAALQQQLNAMNAAKAKGV